MPDEPHAHEQAHMTPETITREAATALYQGKVHFYMPSAEASFALPENDLIDQDSLAQEAVGDHSNSADRE